MKIKAWIKDTTKRVKNKIKILFFALSDPNCPWYAKGFGYVVFAYALSPIDLIPDFIPILGYLDDVLLLPIGIWVFIKLVGNKRWDTYEEMLSDQKLELKKRWYFAIPIIMIWILAIFFFIMLFISKR